MYTWVLFLPGALDSVWNLIFFLPHCLTYFISSGLQVPANHVFPMPLSSFAHIFHPYPLLCLENLLDASKSLPDSPHQVQPCLPLSPPGKLFGSFLYTLAHGLSIRSIDSAYQQIRANHLYFSNSLWVILMDRQALGIFVWSSLVQMMPCLLVLLNHRVPVIQIWSSPSFLLLFYSLHHHIFIKRYYMLVTECLVLVLKGE